MDENEGINDHVREEDFLMKKFELEPHQLTKACDLNCLPFETTEELEPLKAIMGQDRAVEAVKFGLKMKRKGYNIYVGGSWGTGRNSLVRHLSEASAKLRTPPKDWLYVNNFKVARTPIAIGQIGRASCRERV